MGAGRDRWAGLVRRWRRSGQTAREFAESAGVNAGTLTYWAWRLKREGKAKGGGDELPKRRARGSIASSGKGNFVELIVEGREERGFLLDLGDGRRLRIPPEFDAAALGRLLTVLGAWDR
jgi:hypothetical protein